MKTENHHECRASNSRKGLSVRPAGKPYRSKLLPHASVIAKLQRLGRSYGQIAEFLRDAHGLKVHRDTIHSFVVVRSRGRKRRILPAEYLRAEALSHKSEAPEERTATLLESGAVAAAKSVRGSDGKEIRNAQYQPVNPADL